MSTSYSGNIWMIEMPLRTSLHRKPASGRWPRRASNRRDVLSVNMISLPLGDFRHLSHISSDSPVDRSFGDLSFLKEAGHSVMMQSSRSEQNLFLACAPPPKPPRLSPEDGRCSPVWEHTPVNQRQKCSSLPLLDREEAEEEERHSPIQTANSRDGGSLSSGRGSTQTNSEESQADEMDTAFSLDLGPSILDAVLQVMDKLHQQKWDRAWTGSSDNNNTEHLLRVAQPTTSSWKCRIGKPFSRRANSSKPYTLLRPNLKSELCKSLTLSRSHFYIFLIMRMRDETELIIKQRLYFTFWNVYRVPHLHISTQTKDIKRERLCTSTFWGSHWDPFTLNETINLNTFDIKRMSSVTLFIKAI